MSAPQVLYEAEIAKEARKQMSSGLVVLLLWGAIGVVLCFVFTSLPQRLFPLGVFVVGAIGLSIQLPRVMRLRKNTGFYRISIDEYGLYVHSDVPASAPSFSVIAPDLSRLVRKTIKQYESNDDHEYYIETKSGIRHRIEPLFADYNLDVMELFERITERFPWVQILEEVKH